MMVRKRMKECILKRRLGGEDLSWSFYSNCTNVEPKELNFSTKVTVERHLVLYFLLSFILMIFSSSCLRTVNAIENSIFTQSVDGVDTNTSDDYEDYVDNGDSIVKKGEEILKSTGFESNSDPNKTYTESAAASENSEPDESEKNPSEIQKAVCTITAGEVRASAEAVTTKTLKGVCGSAELQLAVNSLEAKLFKELDSIKSLLMQQLATRQQGIPPTNCDCSQTGKFSTEKTPAVSMTTIPQTPLISRFKTQEKYLSHPNNIERSSNQDNSVTPKLKSLKPQHDLQSREKEVSKFNNTMLADKDVKIFSYYWRLENFTERIESGDSINVDSPRFSIKGKPLHLKAYFQHLHRDFLFLQLEYVPAAAYGAKGNLSHRSSGNSNNIMLDMGLLGGGSLFKAISSNDQILFKYKISILDQQNLRSSKDLTSQEFHNLEGGFLIPNSALLKSPYIKDDALLIQLFLYL